MGGGDGALEVVDPLRDTARENERDTAMRSSVQQRVTPGRTTHQE